MEYKSFREHLQTEYLKRVESNPHYSLRSFAKYLQTDPGSLSQFLSKKRDYSAKKIGSIALNLGINTATLSKYLSENKNEWSQFNYLEYEQLQFLNQWYYIAILETFTLDDFQPNAKWIAQKLGLKTSLTNIAINQLMAHRVIKLSETGRWINNWEDFSTQKNELTDEKSLRILQKQLLDLAKESIDTNTAKEKSCTAYISTMDQDLIPVIQDEIRSFRRKIAKLIKTKSKKQDSLYCLQINLYPMDKNKEKET